MEARAHGGFWGVNFGGQNSSHGRKEVIIPRKLDYQVLKNCINDSSISENAIFNDYKMQLFPKFSLSLRSDSCIFFTQHQILKFLNIENWNLALMHEPNMM